MSAGRVHDVVVVGAGNAALCAALAAREAGADVLVLEAAPEAEAGGNSRYTAGAFKFCYEGAQDIHALVPDLTEQERARTDFASYTPERFYDDLFRVTRYRTDPGMADQLVTRSRDTMFWLHGQGVRFTPIWGRMAVRSPEGRFAFSGELVLDAWGGGQGLIAAELASAAKAGIEIRYDHRAAGLIFDGVAVRGVRARTADALVEIPARAVVLACGGFEANAEWRTRYLGPGWELAKVRGTRFNTGEGIRMALEIGAMSTGHWSGCHSVAWDNNAPPTGDLEVGDGFNKFSYPYGIMVNAEGRRFIDEGSDLRIRTYSKMGRAILGQPDGFAWQVFDAKTIPLLTDTYRMRGVAKQRADTLEELAGKLEGVNPAGFLDEVRRFNAAVRTDIPFDRQVTDGRRTEGLAVNKSNWAQAIEEPPFEAYQVGCGITFTFGGLATDPPTGRVLDVSRRPIPGLHAAGELVGGLFYFGYPGGAGLTAGAVFGRLAGQAAAEHARSGGS
ncbi:MAG TPA: FAD-dependent tricarballylate dehydrogenase TcuA [Roseomonas sp.]|jgi:tricarballylate dehydrogenase